MYLRDLKKVYAVRFRLLTNGRFLTWGRVRLRTRGGGFADIPFSPPGRNRPSRILSFRQIELKGDAQVGNLERPKGVSDT